MTPRTSRGEDNDALTSSTRDIKHSFQSVIILLKFSLCVPFAFRVTKANLDIFNGWYSMSLCTVEPGYNDISFCDTSSIASDVLLY
jgi:hypothetical protein